MTADCPLLPPQSSGVPCIQASFLPQPAATDPPIHESDPEGPFVPPSSGLAFPSFFFFSAVPTSASRPRTAMFLPSVQQLRAFIIVMRVVSSGVSGW